MRHAIFYVIPIAINNFTFDRVKTSKIFDRKWYCIALILYHLRSKICRQFSRSSNVKLFIATGITLISTSLFSANYTPKDYSHLMGMPGFSNELLEMHFKLYRGYVQNANDLLETISKIENTSSYEFGALKRRVGWEFDGMRLHELYFDNLGGKDQSLSKNTSLYKAMVAEFGSYEKWKKDFISVGKMRGIGWALLYLDPEQNRLINVWINEHDTGHLVNGKPILIMDVFEHAYMPQYGLDKGKYIDAFFDNIDWDTVSNRYPLKK